MVVTTYDYEVFMTDIRDRVINILKLPVSDEHY